MRPYRRRLLDGPHTTRKPDWAILGLLSLLLIVFTAARVLHWARRMRYHADDVAGAASHRGVARVVSVTYMQGNVAAPERAPVYVVEFRDRQFTIKGRTIARPGDNVSIEYREGRSGEIYVEEIGEPVRAGSG